MPILCDCTLSAPVTRTYWQPQGDGAAVATAQCSQSMAPQPRRGSRQHAALARRPDLGRAAGAQTQPGTLKFRFKIIYFILSGFGSSNGAIALSRQGQLAAWAARRRCHADYKHEERGRADLDQPDSMRHARIAQGASLPHCHLPSPRRDAAGRPRTPTEPAAALRAVRQRTATHSAQQR